MDIIYDFIHKNQVTKCCYKSFSFHFNNLQKIAMFCLYYKCNFTMLTCVVLSSELWNFTRLTRSIRIYDCTRMEGNIHTWILHTRTWTHQSKKTKKWRRSKGIYSNSHIKREMLQKTSSCFQRFPKDEGLWRNKPSCHHQI